MNFADLLGTTVDLEKFPELAPRKAPDFKKLAASKNKKALAKAKESAGPLFAEQVEADIELTTPEQEAWKWHVQQVTRADMSEHYGRFAKNLVWFQLWAIECFASRHLGDSFDGVKGYIRKTYPMPDYSPHVWKEILVRGRKIVYSFTVTDHPDGKRTLAPKDFVEVEPVTTAAEFDARFYLPTHEPEPTCVEHEAIHAQFVELLKKK